MEDITIDEWQAYEDVRRNGLYRMNSPEAVRMSGLNIDIYTTILSNYDELSKRFKDKNK